MSFDSRVWQKKYKRRKARAYDGKSGEKERIEERKEGRMKGSKEGKKIGGW